MVRHWPVLCLTRIRAVQTVGDGRRAGGFCDWRRLQQAVGHRPDALDAVNGHHPARSVAGPVTLSIANPVADTVAEPDAPASPAAGVNRAAQ
jgi:hypothetical protein